MVMRRVLVGTVFPIESPPYTFCRMVINLSASLDPLSD
jgi:hypothetical protein